MNNILYLHGMGGGSSSAVPRRLRSELSKMNLTKDGEPCNVKVICETYDFDPEVATRQIAQWVESYHPDLVIGESLGAVHALGIHGIPHIYISPALNLDKASGLIPIGIMLRNMYSGNHGGNGRQVLTNDSELIARFKPMVRAYKQAIVNSPQRDVSYAFFGQCDPLKLVNIVSIKEYEHICGGDHMVYDGGHLFDVRKGYVKSLLIPKVVEMLGLEEVKPTPRRNKNHIH